MSSKFLMNAVNPIAITDVIGLQDELDEIQEEIASGGGGVSYAAGSFLQENGIVFRNGTDADKVKNASGFALIDVFGIGNSLLCNDIQLPTINSVAQTINDNKSKLTQVDYDDTDPQKPITSIRGELDVDKIKNIDHTAEIEFEDTGKLLIKCDNSITLSSTSNNIRNVTNQGIDFLDNTELTGIAINPTNSRMDFIKSNIVRGSIDLINNTDLRINANTNDLYLQGGSVNLTGQTEIVMTSTLNNIRNITNQGVDFLDITELTGLAINPSNTQMDFIKSNIVRGTIALNNATDTLDIVGNAGLVLTANNDGANINIVIPTGGQLLTNNTPTEPTSITTMGYVDDAIQNAQYPKVTKYRVPKSPAVDVFQDDYIILRWDGDGNNYLKGKTKAVGTFNFNFTRSGTSAVQERIITSPGGNYITLNSAFAFGGGDVMIGHIQPDNLNRPSYRVTLHYTESGLVTGDIIWIVEVF